jgi:gliding motility-associated-like protein
MKKNLHRLFTVSIILLLSAVFSKVQAQTIIAGAATGNISACLGTVSASPNIQQFKVAGTGLTGSIIATAPTGFEVSLSAGSGYGGTVTLSQTGGVISSTTVYVRSAATAPAGSISGNVVLSSAGVTSQNTAVTGRINALPVTDPITNQTFKNGDTTAAISFTGTGNTFTWVNNTPGIGLAAGGTGDIAAFTAVNTSFSPVTATITVTPQVAPLAYVANGEDDNTVSVINTITNKVIATIPVGSGPFNVAVSPDNSKVYVVNTNSYSVSVINTATNTVTATIDLHLNARPAAITVSPDGSKVYVGYSFGTTVTVINAATNTITATITLTGYTSGLALSPDGSRLYVTDAGGISNAIHIINTATNAVIGSIKAVKAQAIILSPDGSKIYALNYHSNAVSVIDATTNVVTTTIPVGESPWGVALSPDGSVLYVTNSYSDNISVINTATNVVTATFPAGSNPFGISVTQDGRFLYVESPGNNNVLVINAATHATVATIPVGAEPMSYGNFITGGTSCAGAPVTFTITVNPTPPGIQVGTRVGNISACLGTASLNTQRFIVTANGLTDNITATAPTNFEVSLAAGSGYGGSVMLTQSGGIVSSTVVYVRSVSSAPVGTMSGNVVLSTTGFTSQTVAVTGTIKALPVIAPVPNQTVASGSTAAAVIFSGGSNSFSWVNNTPGIGLAASGTGDIASFTAINSGTSPVTATITATPVPIGFAYVASEVSNNVSVINTTTNTVVATIPVVGVDPRCIAVSPDGARVYVGSYYPGNISVIDAATNTRVATIGNIPNCESLVVSMDGDILYATYYNRDGAGGVAAISTATNEVISDYAAGDYPNGVAISPDGSRLYVSSLQPGVITVNNTLTKAVIATIQVGSDPFAISISPDGSRLYVANSNKVSVINTSTNKVVSTITSGLNSRYSILVNPTGDLVYLTNGGGTVAVISTALNKVVRTIYVDRGDPSGLSLSPDGSKLYVVNFTPGTVSVIDVATSTIVATVSVDLQASSFGNFVTAGAGCNGAPITFTITVNPSNNPSLSSLTMNPGSPLILASSAVGTVNYTTGVDATTSSVTLTPTATYPNSTITVNGVPVTSGTASAPIPLNSGPTLITTVVTAPDGIATKTYTVTVNRTGSNSGALSTLILSPASPLVLTSATVSNVDYKTSVDPSINTVTFTPTVVEAGATITVNGVAVSSGSASGPITLNTGPTTITVLVTAPDGSTIKTYAVTVIRASNNATLSTLIMNPPGAMFPAFGPASVNYTTAVDPAVSSIRITPTTQDANATVTVNGVPVSSGAASGVIALNSGPTLITTVVTAPDGITTKTYNVTVNRTGSNNGTLSSLVMNPGSTLFLTSANTTAVDYTTSVEPTVTSVTFTPSVQQPGATVTVNGVAVSNGSASGPIALNSGPTIIPTVVTAPDGVTTKTYYVTVNKVGSNNARLISLVLNPHSALALVSSTPTNVEYTTVVPDTVGTVTLTAITTDPNATFTINGTNASPATITLNVGDNLVTTLVTAHDGVTTKTYNITITRPAALVGVVNKHSLSLPAVVGSLADNMQNDGITVHQGVSPNGDGIADVLTIDGITAYPDNKLTIVDRSGAPVFEASGYDNTSKVFNGRSNKTGAMQHAGTYYYLLEYRNKGQLKRKTGYLIIKY